MIMEVILNIFVVGIVFLAIASFVIEEANRNKTIEIKEKIIPLVRMNHLKIKQGIFSDDIKMKNELLEEIHFNNKEILEILKNHKETDQTKNMFNIHVEQDGRISSKSINSTKNNVSVIKKSE